MGKRILAFFLPILLLLFLIFYTNSNRTQHEEAFDGVQSDFRAELENAELEPTEMMIYTYIVIWKLIITVCITAP